LEPLDAAGVPAPAADVTNQATGQLPVPPDGVPHLASPDALPPGSTMDPTVMGNEGPNTSYLKDLWHAVQNQEISGKEALIMGFAQRGMNTPYPVQAPGPNVPISGTDPALPAAAPPAHCLRAARSRASARSRACSAPAAARPPGPLPCYARPADSVTSPAAVSRQARSSSSSTMRTMGALDGRHTARVAGVR
jgi:hypothetical protein